MVGGGIHFTPYDGVLAVGRDFLIFWEFIDGLYLIKGVDLVDLFSKLDAYRSFNVIDSLLIEDGLSNGEADGAIEKARLAILKIYNKTYDTPSSEEYDKMYGTRSDYSRPVKPYIPVVEPDAGGYPGLGPPVN